MAIDISKMSLPELFKHIGELPTAKRTNALKQIANLTPELVTLLKYTYREDVKFSLPTGKPPYRPMETPGNWGHNRIPAEMRKFQYLVPTSNVPQIKRESIFIEMLETVSPDEAELLLMVKEKKLTYKGITRKLVEEALPEIFDGDTKQKNG
jgi:hypothetical protein